MTSASHAINQTLYKKLPYDVLRDFVGVSFATSVPNVLVVAPSLGVKTVPELPVVSDFVPGVVYDHWYGMMAPAKTPRPVVEQISRDVNGVLRMPDVTPGLRTSRAQPLP